MNEQQAHDSSVHESSFPVSPSEAGDEGGEDEAHEDDEPQEVLVLPSDDGVLGQVGHICDTGSATGLDEHPAHVRVKETLQKGKEVGSKRVEPKTYLCVHCKDQGRYPYTDDEHDGHETTILSSPRLRPPRGSQECTEVAQKHCRICVPTGDGSPQ